MPNYISSEPAYADRRLIPRETIFFTLQTANPAWRTPTAAEYAQAAAVAPSPFGAFIEPAELPAALSGVGAGVGGLSVPLPPAGPAGVVWNSAAYPLNIYRDRKGVYSTDFNAIQYLPAGLLSAPIYYVDNAAGSDANSGLTAALAVKSLWKAFALGNATNAPYQVAIKGGTSNLGNVAGDYGRDIGWADPDNLSGGGTNTGRPRQHCWIWGYGGRVRVGTHNNAFTSTANATYAAQGVYDLNDTRGATFIGDLAALDAFGDYTEYTKVASLALCSTTPGSYFQSAAGSTISVNRLDGKQPTPTNTRLFVQGSRNAFISGDCSAYVSNIEFEGGASDGCIATFDAGSAAPTNPALARTLIVEDCTAKYGRRPPAGGNQMQSFGINQFTGLVVFRRCAGSKADADTFNVHNTTGQSTCNALLIDCKGWDTGRSPSLSNNVYTVHDNCPMIVINADAQGGMGGTIGHSLGSWLVVFGGRAFNDKGDGTTISTSVGANDANTVGHYYELNTYGSLRSYVANTGVALYLHGQCADGGGQRTGSVTQV